MWSTISFIAICKQATREDPSFHNKRDPNHDLQSSALVRTFLHTWVVEKKFGLRHPSKKVRCGHFNKWFMVVPFASKRTSTLDFYLQTVLFAPFDTFDLLSGPRLRAAISGMIF